MSLNGLRFTLEVDGLAANTFTVVRFGLNQHYSSPFALDVDVASNSFGQTAEQLLEKNATLTIWQGAEARRCVTGVVVTFGMKENNGWQMQYHLRIHPPPLAQCATSEFPQFPAARYSDYFRPSSE